MVSSKFQPVLEKLADCLGMLVEYKDIRFKRKLEDYPKVCQQQAFVANENLCAYGVGNSKLSAREDAARKLLRIILENYCSKIIEILSQSHLPVPEKNDADIRPDIINHQKQLSNQQQPDSDSNIRRRRVTSQEKNE